MPLATALKRVSLFLVTYQLWTEVLKDFIYQIFNDVYKTYKHKFKIIFQVLYSLHFIFFLTYKWAQ